MFYHTHTARLQDTVSITCSCLGVELTKGEGRVNIKESWNNAKRFINLSTSTAACDMQPLYPIFSLSTLL
jgi:hypothetical protein